MDAADLFVPGPPDDSAAAGAPGPADAAGTASDPDARRRRQRRLARLMWALAAGLLVVDQATKAVAVRTLSEGERTPLLGDLLGLKLLYNPGAAFSLGGRYTVVFTVIMLVVIVLVARSARRLGSRGWAWALGLLVGGAAGNLVDRLLRPPGPGRGEVVDFIAYGGWFIGNVADIAIVAAAAGVALLSLYGIALDGTREGGHA
jgi:signal peptidase II